MNAKKLLNKPADSENEHKKLENLVKRLRLQISKMSRELELTKFRMREARRETTRVTAEHQALLAKLKRTS